MKKTGIVDVGGGLRGIYAAGVLDYCMDQGILFDLGIGVSAGSANLISYMAGQNLRNFSFYADYSMRPEYMGLGNFLRKGSYIDLDYVYGTLSNSGGENPLDYDAVMNNPMDFLVVAAEAETGRTKYFEKSRIRQDDYCILKASSAIPFVCKPYEVDGVAYYDGALADPVPVQKAFAMGCDRVIVLLTMPKEQLRIADRDRALARMIRKKYPIAAQKLEQRAQHYNEGVALAQKYAEQGRALIVAPRETFGVGTLSRDRAALQQLYDSGYVDGQKITRFLRE